MVLIDILKNVVDKDFEIYEHNTERCLGRFHDEEDVIAYMEQKQMIDALMVM